MLISVISPCTNVTQRLIKGKTAALNLPRRVAFPGQLPGNTAQPIRAGCFLPIWTAQRNFANIQILSAEHRYDHEQCGPLSSSPCRRSAPHRTRHPAAVRRAVMGVILGPFRRKQAPMSIVKSARLSRPPVPHRALHPQPTAPSPHCDLSPGEARGFKPEDASFFLLLVQEARGQRAW